MKILLTGATGFVGSALMHRLASSPDWQLRVALRRPATDAGIRCEQVLVEDLATSELRPATSGCDVVVHAAARAHVMQEHAASPLAEYRRINTQATLRLARQAAEEGARRFVFLSSVKVHGEETRPGEAFDADSPAHPEDAYATSKHEAEVGLHALAEQTGIQVVVIRSPLVYGPGVRANFHALMRAVARGMPLPLGAIDNRRSLVALDNLVDLVALCTYHPGAANEAFLVSDGEDLSTAELVRRLAWHMRRHTRLLPVPLRLLKAAAALAGRSAAVRRLCSNLQVDIEKTRQRLQWAPPVSVDEGLRRAVAGMAGR